MIQNISLSQFKLLHYTFTKIIQALLNPIEMLEFEDVFSQLKTVKLLELKVKNKLLSVKLCYDKEEAFILNSIGCEVCMSNQFELIINTEEVEDKSARIISMDFLHHNLDFLIQEVSNEFTTKELSHTIKQTLQDLKFIIPEVNRETALESDIEKLLLWAVEKKIDKNVLPHSKEKLLALEVLNLSNIPLQKIPKHIRVLKNLKKLYLANCQLAQLPLEVYTLKNLEILWIQNNHLTTISSEINRLTNLRELIAYENILQKLPSMKSLKKLSFIALHRNLLVVEEITKVLKTLSENAQCTFYDQRGKYPFIIEALSYMTLKEAETLRDRIFKDDLEDIEKGLLLASLDTTRYKKICAANEVRTVSYWVAKDIKSGKVIGLTGIYTEDEDESCWLGWFCIDEEYRGKEFGKRLLEFSIEQAKNMGKKYLHVYTYKAKRFKTAITMYKQYGFVEYQEKRDDDTHAIYLKKIIGEE